MTRKTHPVGLAGHVEGTSFVLGERLEEESDECVDVLGGVFRRADGLAEVGIRETDANTAVGLCSVSERCHIKDSKRTHG